VFLSPPRGLGLTTLAACGVALKQRQRRRLLSTLPSRGRSLFAGGPCEREAASPAAAGLQLLAARSPMRRRAVRNRLGIRGWADGEAWIVTTGCSAKTARAFSGSTAVDSVGRPKARAQFRLRGSGLLAVCPAELEQG